MSTEATGCASAIQPGPEMTINFAGACHDRLAQAMEARPGPLHVDLGGVTDFDSAGVQLLLALRRSLSERGDALVITAASPAVRDGIAVFGLLGLLGLTPQPAAPAIAIPA
jgi:anti-anti-sigma factor